MKNFVLLLMALAALAFAACSTTNYSANMSGASDQATVAVKDFITLGIITVRATETHSGGFGRAGRVEGSKITFADLMQEAAKLEADDIINVRIDMNTNYVGNAFAWTRTFSYTGTALAIKYADMVETQQGDPQLRGLPRTPETTRAVRTTKDGRVELR